MSTERQIIISPDFGAGWSTWQYGEREHRLFALTYQPLIDAILNGRDVGYIGGYPPIADFQTFDPVTGEMSFDDLGHTRASCVEGSPLDQFVLDFYNRFEETPTILGARELAVVTVRQPFRVNEYDGSETVETFSIEAFTRPEELPVF